MKALLTKYLENSVRQFPSHTAIEEPEEGSISYEELDGLASSVCERLRNLGVSRGDRVGIFMRKSIDAIASICGILKGGAAYVPVDPTAPVSRGAYILSD